MFIHLIIVKNCLETNLYNEEMNFVTFGDFSIVRSLIGWIAESDGFDERVCGSKVDRTTFKKKAFGIRLVQEDRD